MNHSELMAITASLPMKTIIINDEPYLERYFDTELPDGSQVWIHRFLRNDSERHLHSHPWNAQSKVLLGSYTESLGMTTATYTAGDTNVIPAHKLHRIIEVEPNTWTIMTVAPERLAQWYFIDELGNRENMKASPVDWYKDCAPRAEENV